LPQIGLIINHYKQFLDGYLHNYKQPIIKPLYCHLAKYTHL